MIFLAKLLRLEPGEVGRVFAFMALGAILQAGLAMGMSAADSLFLVNVGADRLPIIYIGTPVMMMFYIPAYSYLLGRYGIDRVFNFTLGLLFCGGTGFFFLLSHRAGTAAPIAAYYAVKLYAALWYIGIYSLLWNFVDGYFDLSNAKRLFGLVAGGCAGGAVLGGSIVNQLSELIDVRTFFLFWGIAAVAALPVLRLIRSRYQRIESMPDGTADARRPFRQTLRDATGSRFVVVLILVLFLTLVTATVCEYQYMHIFSEAADEKALAALFGELFAIVNVFNLLVTVFFFNKLVLRFGVRNTALIQPITYLVVFGFLLIDHGFVGGFLGFVAFQGIETSIDYNNVNLLFNGLKESGKKQLRTFVEGICEPLATATAGVFLFFVAPKLSPGDLSSLGFLCAIACLLLVLVLRHDYVKVMVENIRQGWLDFTKARDDTLSDLCEPELEYLEQHARTASSEVRLSALRLLWRNAPKRAMDQIFSFLATAGPHDRQAARPLLAAMLASQDRDLLHRCVEWSAGQADTLDPLLFEEFGRHGLMPVEAGAERLQAPDPADRAAAATLFWQSGRLAESRTALNSIESLLQSGRAERIAGLHSLGRIGEARFIPYLLPHLKDPDPAVRHEALVALHELSSRKTMRLVEPLLELLADGGTAGDRLLIFDIFGRVADSAALGPLLAQAGRFTPRERRRAEQIIIDVGPGAVPTLVSVVQNLGSPLFARSIAARTLGRLALPQLQALAPPLIESIVRRSYDFISYQVALEHEKSRGPGFAMLANVYRDLPRLTIEMTLELLSVTGRLPGYDSIVSALRCGNAKEKSYALENIEQGCHRQLFARLVPFLDGRPPAATLAAGRRAGLVAEYTVLDAVKRSLAVPFALESSSALQAFYELEPAGARQATLEKLRAHPLPMVRETALALLGRGLPQPSTAVTPVERTLHIASTEFFKGWGVRQLEIIAPCAELRRVSNETRLYGAGDEADGIYVLISGGVTLQTGEIRRSVAARQTFGEGPLLGSSTRTETATAKDATVMFVPASAVRACAAVHTQIAMDLLRLKLSA